MVEQRNIFINDYNNKIYSLTSLLMDEQQNTFINDCKNKTKTDDDENMFKQEH